LELAWLRLSFLEYLVTGQSYT